MGGESKIEGFHPIIFLFANSGCRPELADDFGLSGTCQYNMNIRKRVQLDEMSAEERMKVPYYFQGVPLYFNDTNLAVVNKQARQVIL